MTEIWFEKICRYIMWYFPGISTSFSVVLCLWNLAISQSANQQHELIDNMLTLQLASTADEDDDHDEHDDDERTPQADCNASAT